MLLAAGMLVSCGGGTGDSGGNASPPPGDGPVPTVSIVAPGPGRTVSGSIAVTAMANVAVAGIQFQVDGTNTGVEDTEAPYSITWNTTTAGDGPHTLTAIARDTGGNLVPSAPIPVMVANIPLPPEPPEPPVPGRAEETDAAVTLSPGWTQAIPDWYARSGGSAVQSAVPLATATYTFTGTSVTWIGQRSNISGIALVKVDGGAGVLVDLYAHNFETNSPVYAVNGLSPGTHTLTIQVTGNQNELAQGNAVVVDAFAVPAPVVSHLQETDPDVAFTGEWAQADNNSGWSGGGLATVPAPPVGGARVTETSGAKATLTFRGTAISWIGYRGRDGGKASVTLDGGVPTIVDAYSSSFKMQATVFTATGLADVVHTLTIEALGTHNSLSTGSKIIVDAFDVTTPGRRYQEEDPSVVYSPGDWIFRNLNRTWSEGSVSESQVAGAFVTFTFTGTSVSWIGCRKLSTGEADIYLDGNFVEHVSTWLAPAPPDTLAVGTEAYQTTIYRVDNLPLALHTLKIVHTSTTGSYTVIDAFDVRQ
ncbi:MAG TPA: Ig-like domain-containing protein [Burkholderiales bacterium]|nr:Ig-like domain-containing protein [Burkholderiales bacterium]